MYFLAIRQIISVEGVLSRYSLVVVSTSAYWGEVAHLINLP